MSRVSRRSVWSSQGVFMTLLWRVQASSATEAFSSLSHRLFWPPRAPCLLSSAHLPSTHLHPGLKLQLCSALANPHLPQGFTDRAIFLFWEFPPFLLLLQLKKTSIWVSPDKQIWLPQNPPQLSEAWQEPPLWGAAGGQKHW